MKIPNRHERRAVAKQQRSKRLAVYSLLKDNLSHAIVGDAVVLIITDRFEMSESEFTRHYRTTLRKNHPGISDDEIDAATPIAHSIIRRLMAETSGEHWCSPQFFAEDVPRAIRIWMDVFGYVMKGSGVGVSELDIVMVEGILDGTFEPVPGGRPGAIRIAAAHFAELDAKRLDATPSAAH